MSPDTRLIPVVCSPLLVGLDPFDKDRLSRLTMFARWLAATNRSWATPDLAAYRTVLLGERGLAPSSAAAHFSTIRGRYQTLLATTRSATCSMPRRPPISAPPSARH